MYWQRLYHTLVLLLDKVTDDLVIEIGDGFPSNALAAIFILFGFERQFDEQLLKLLVAVINAELFETVGLEDFKAVNVQNAEYDFLLDLGTRLQRAIKSLDEPVKHALVNGFGQSVARFNSFIAPHWRYHNVIACFNCTVQQSFHQLIFRASEKLMHNIEKQFFIFKTPQF